MLDRKTLQALGCWSGYRLERVVWPEGESPTLALYLKPTSKAMHCQECAARCRQVHETTVQPCPSSTTGWFCTCRAGVCWCEQCGGPRLERLDWLGRYQRVTARLAEACVVGCCATARCEPSLRSMNGGGTPSSPSTRHA
ncbi:protein of unknown function (plasmid) [Cupriavidus taiwanensis]|uniref:Transposase n=1 Tax=Cupriavidus taiwanensis TaxID=164546 RepID=A0A375ISI1_9BURK|nr:protein of unknown function [Cupriavidus taiwanensis]